MKKNKKPKKKLFFIKICFTLLLYKKIDFYFFFNIYFIQLYRWRLLTLALHNLKRNLPCLCPPDPDDIPNPKHKAKAKAKTKAKEVDEEQPKKKRTSGYILYSNAKRPEVKERLLQEADDNRIKNTDVMKELARMWMELDDQEKAIWNTKANENN